jgi:hypothetical protein
MGLFDLFKKKLEPGSKGATRSPVLNRAPDKREDRPIEKDSQWNPGTKLKFMTYNEAIRELKSGDPARMEKAISDILNVPKDYNDISNSLNSPSDERLINLLLPLLKHEEYRVRCCIPGIFEVIGDASCIPHLEDVIKHDSDSQVVKNARIAIDKINRLGVSTDTVKFLRRYTKPIDRTTTGTYEEYSAPNKNVARAFLERMPPVTQAYFYIEIITPEGNIGKDNMGTY